MLWNRCNQEKLYQPLDVLAGFASNSLKHLALLKTKLMNTGCDFGLIFTPMEKLGLYNPALMT